MFKTGWVRRLAAAIILGNLAYFFVQGVAWVEGKLWGVNFWQEVSALMVALFVGGIYASLEADDGDTKTHS